ncbi:uncharacterized protein [Spinacia oleracea]|uniref:Uncharacterized protein n=1 Tax=Spinacia oleracea TaxID=3562 RepID=A0A9R0JQU7_SPIOL|nr:uncharacterized protein LOC110783247 [Spinacia oleracea]
MASVQQQAHGENQLSDKEKASIGEAMKEAKSLAKNMNTKAASNQDVLTTVIGVMKNLCSIEIERLGEEWNWLGSFQDPPPQKIEKNGIGSFAHTSPPGQYRCSGAFKYCSVSGSNPQLGWILAWEKYRTSTIYGKVYVEAGSLDRINKLVKSDIQKKLAASGTTSRYWDSDTGASVVAEISDWEIPGGLIAVSFDQK